jgi:protein-disulfide isomerase
MQVTAAFALIAVVVIGAAFWLTHQSSTPPIEPITPKVLTPSDIPSNGRTLGQANAPVTVDLYGDFRCSQCLAFTTDGDEAGLVKDYVATGKAKLVWHDLITIDTAPETASRDAANAAWCAADQGKFWLMHDWLFANQASDESSLAFSPDRLTAMAKAIRLDMTLFQPCVDLGTHKAAIAAESNSLAKAIPSTPTVYVNGTAVNAAGQGVSYEMIKAAIDAALASPKASPAAS